MPLKAELVALGGRAEPARRTTPGCALHALATTPPKPGLSAPPGAAGPGIAVAVRSLPTEGFARYVAGLPRPMGIGKVALVNGALHRGFPSETYVLDGATDITRFGG